LGQIEVGSEMWGKEFDEVYEEGFQKGFEELVVIDGCCHGGLGSGRENFAIRAGLVALFLICGFENPNAGGSPPHPPEY
jgi:hypothetical protein